MGSTGGNDGESRTSGQNTYARLSDWLQLFLGLPQKIHGKLARLDNTRLQASIRRTTYTAHSSRLVFFSSNLLDAGAKRGGGRFAAPADKQSSGTMSGFRWCNPRDRAKASGEAIFALF